MKVKIDCDAYHSRYTFDSVTCSSDSECVFSLTIDHLLFIFVAWHLLSMFRASKYLPTHAFSCFSWSRKICTASTNLYVSYRRRRITTSSDWRWANLSFDLSFTFHTGTQDKFLPVVDRLYDGFILETILLSLMFNKFFRNKINLCMYTLFIWLSALPLTMTFVFCTIAVS